MEPSISPITLSSSRSSTSTSSLSVLRRRPEKCKSVISIDSSEYNGHMHLGWKRRNKASKSMRSTSQLSNIQKVANWIKSIEESNIYNVNDGECENEIIEDDIKSNVLGEKGKGFVVVKCDYMKQLSTQSESYNKHSNTVSYSNCVEKYKAQTPRSLIKIPTKNEIKQNGKMVNLTDRVSLISSVDKESYSSSIKFYDEKSDVSSDLCELPKSLEVRKKELCTYLKLMDPSDKKEILALQNRRSTRVRNLAALRERINLEKKIRETTSEILVNDDHQNGQSVSVKPNENYTSNDDELDAIISRTSNLIPQKEATSMQKESFIIHEGESNIKLNIQDSSLKKKNTCNEKYPFYFPFPPAIQIQNFDNTMEKLIPKFKISLAKKESSQNHTLQSSNLSRNKENIQSGKSECGEKKNELEICNMVSKTNFQNKKPKEISNKIKCKSKINILSLKGKKQIISNRKLDKLSAKIYNLKLRSTKFKIRLKRVPTEQDLMKNKKRIKKSSNNSKCIKNIELKNDKLILINKKKSSDNLTKTSENVPQIALQQNEIDPVFKTKSKFPNSCELQEEKETIDFQKLQMDVNDFNNLTEEHKKCLIESRLLMSTSNNNYESEKLLGPEEVPPLYGFSTSDINEIKLMCEIFEQSILKHSQKRFKDNSEMIQTETTLMLEQNGKPNDNINNCTECDFVEKSHNYTPTEKQSNKNYCCAIGETNNTKTNSPNLLIIAEKPLTENCCVQIDPNDVEENNCTILPYDRNIEIKSLQKSLNFIKKKNSISSPEANICHDWDMDSPKPKKKKLSHFISISEENGLILRAFYVDFNLVICQEFVVSFWMQTPLGNVLGSQDMWIPRGNTQRLMLNNKCIQKESKEMLFCSDTNVAYVELWTKEHKSDIREGPVADIFITIYFWKQRQTGIDKKVLQLENITGFADDVQYCVMKSLPKIIVSWHVTTEDNILRTFVHAYQLAPDYQMVSYISEIEPVDHYVSSLHNIEGCDNLIVGCGEKKITLWNLEYGHKIATIELSEMGPQLSTLWVKCDRGFLFAIQQCGNKELRLIAINGINHSWKKLASYFPSEGFDGLKGVCIENGLLLSFYDKGILCWKAETGEPVEEVMMDTILFTSGNHVIFLEKDNVFVRHSLTHLLSASADEQ